MLKRAIEKFIHHEASSGVILVAAAALALILDNSPLSGLYDALLTTPMVIQIGLLELNKPLLLWINDGLMAVFFLLVGLEIKREMIKGQLSTRGQLILPAAAAFGGMAAPAAIYLAVTAGEPALADGWAIPAATDIAFALGVLSLLGKAVPLTLKVFLLALAIIDDLGAILIIAVFYTADLSPSMLAGAVVAIVALTLLNQMNVRAVTPYVLVGIVLWVFVLKSGVHATLAGVALAFAIPIRGGRSDDKSSPLERMEHNLHPWIAYGVMPAFAFANAGVSLGGFTPASLLEPLPLAIALGLVVGKQIGVFGAALLVIKSGFARLPHGVNWMMLYGVSCLAGIGFTMSLFIGTLAFADPDAAAGVRIGVLCGSLVSATIGYIVLRMIASSTRRAAAEQETALSAAE